PALQLTDFALRVLQVLHRAVDLARLRMNELPRVTHRRSHSRMRRPTHSAICGTRESPRAARRSTRAGTPLATRPTSGSELHHSRLERPLSSGRRLGYPVGLLCRNPDPAGNPLIAG